MKFTTSTPRIAVTIQALALSTIAPYAAGAVLNENEAAVLNQTLSENLRNNFAKTVDKAKEDAVKAGGADATPDLTALQAAFDKYITEYEFGVRKTHITDPVEREAKALATDAVKAALAKKSIKVGTGDGKMAKEKFDELVATYAAKPAVQDEAKRRVKQAAKLGGEDLGL